MLKTEFPDEVDPMAAFQKSMGHDPDLKYDKDLAPKEKWKVARKLIMAKKRKEARNIMKFGKNVDLERKYFDQWKTKVFGPKKKKRKRAKTEGENLDSSESQKNVRFEPQKAEQPRTVVKKKVRKKISTKKTTKSIS